jgi:hypothetical protein
MMVSQKLRAAIKLGDTPAYKLAQQAGLNPSTLSKLICGIEQPKPGDPRVISVGRILGLEPEECFER